MRRELHPATRRAVYVNEGNEPDVVDLLRDIPGIRINPPPNATRALQTLVGEVRGDRHPGDRKRALRVQRYYAVNSDNEIVFAE